MDIFCFTFSLFNYVQPLKNGSSESVLSFIQGMESKLNMSFTVRALRDTDKQTK